MWFWSCPDSKKTHLRVCCFEALGVLVWLILARSLDPAVCDMQPGKTAGNPNISASLCNKIRLYWVVDAEKVLDCWLDVCGQSWLCSRGSKTVSYTEFQADVDVKVRVFGGNFLPQTVSLIRFKRMSMWSRRGSVHKARLGENWRDGAPSHI